MSSKTPAEVRTLVATRVAAQLSTLRQAAEPYAFLKANLRSMAPNTFVVGKGKAEPVGVRQRPSEGVQTHTEIIILVALQAQASDHLSIEDAMGAVSQALRVALCADWTVDLAMVWTGDAEPTATETLVKFETRFLAIHQTPLE